MLSLIKAILASILALVRLRRNLVLENLALRHQLAVLNRTTSVKRFHGCDRLFWVLLCSENRACFSRSA